jgi:hypothetical protein
MPEYKETLENKTENALVALDIFNLDRICHSSHERNNATWHKIKEEIKPHKILKLDFLEKIIIDSNAVVRNNTKRSHIPFYHVSLKTIFCKSIVQYNKHHNQNIQDSEKFILYKDASCITFSHPLLFSSHSHCCPNQWQPLIWPPLVNNFVI